MSHNLEHQKVHTRMVKEVLKAVARANNHPYQGFRMVRYYGFLSSAKCRLLEEVVYTITETVRKTARQIT